VPAPVFAALLAHVLLSAGTFIVAKVALGQFDPMALAQLRFVSAGRRCSACSPPGGSSTSGRCAARSARWRLLGFVGTTLNQGLFLFGLGRSTSAHGALLYAATPIVVLTIALARGQERASPKRALGVLLAFGGVAFLLLGAGSPSIRAGSWATSSSSSRWSRGPCTPRAAGS
jgi:drug/metabolite transporter (DMT)-like permease